MAEKTLNYTPEQTAKMVADYQAGITVEALAETLGKSVRSVVAKLSREGVYVAKTKAGAAGRVTKADMVAKIALATGTNPEVFASLEKATHEALEVLASKLT